MRASLVLVVAAVASLGALTHRPIPQAQATDEHVHAIDAPHAPYVVTAQLAGGIPASGTDAEARLAASPRRGAWQIIKMSATDSVIAWVVQPQGTAKAPVVVVIHENMGLNTWTRSVADQLAADGFIAIAPDLITMKRAPGTSLTADWGPAGGPAITSLSNDDAQRALDAAAKFAMALPNAIQKYGIVGFCWGGGKSFLHAVHSPSLGASVVYYGTPPTQDEITVVKAPVLGLYGGADARVSSTVPGTDSTMKRLGKTYEYHIFDGAGHGFLKGQEPAGGPNLNAAKAAWPMTVSWLKKYLMS